MMPAPKLSISNVNHQFPTTGGCRLELNYVEYSEPLILTCLAYIAREARFALARVGLHPFHTSSTIQARQLVTPISCQYIQG